MTPKPKIKAGPRTIDEYLDVLSNDKRAALQRLRRKLFFTTDWQFGPRRVTRGGEITLTTFWEWHTKHRLRLNGCYTIVETPNRQLERAGARRRSQTVASRARRSAAGR